MKKSEPAPVCGNCGTTEGLKPCGRCHLQLYCGKPCQTAHWKAVGGHKASCIDLKARSPAVVGAAAEETLPNYDVCLDVKCPICLAPVTLCTRAHLPCGHVFHGDCMTQLKDKCPVCMAPFKPLPQLLSGMLPEETALAFKVSPNERERELFDAYKADLKTAAGHRHWQSILQLLRVVDPETKNDLLRGCLFLDLKFELTEASFFALEARFRGRENDNFEKAITLFLNRPVPDARIDEIISFFTRTGLSSEEETRRINVAFNLFMAMHKHPRWRGKMAFQIGMVMYDSGVRESDHQKKRTLTLALDYFLMGLEEKLHHPALIGVLEKTCSILAFLKRMHECETRAGQLVKLDPGNEVGLKYMKKKKSS